METLFSAGVPGTSPGTIDFVGDDATAVVDDNGLIVTVARVPATAVAGFPEGTDRIYLIDPLGNYVLAWPSKPDVKAMAKDIARLLRASAIG